MTQPIKFLRNNWRLNEQGVVEPKPEDGYEYRLHNQYGPLHCETGPAMVQYDWYNGWFINDKLHRVDGPAQEWVSGYKEWWYQGIKLACSTQEEFEELLKLKAFW